MSQKNLPTLGDRASVTIEDLTLDELEAGNVKGGPADYLLELDGVKGESKTSRSADRMTWDVGTAKKR
jgi:hypothetical protein